MCLNSDAGEGCAVLYSTNNFNWNVVYSTAYAPLNSPATVTLPAAANNQSQLRLRFQRVANSFEEVYDVDNITLTAGGSGGGGSCTGTPAAVPDCIRTNRAPRQSAQDALATHALCEQIVRQLEAAGASASAMQL